jgi:hypothetical protein
MRKQECVLAAALAAMLLCACGSRLFSPAGGAGASPGDAGAAGQENPGTAGEESSGAAADTGTVLSGETDADGEDDPDAAALALAEATDQAETNGAGVIRSGGRLYFRYRDSFYELTEETGEIRNIISLEGGEQTSAFWIYRGGFYFDMEYQDEAGDGLTGLYRMSLTDGSTVHMADINFVPTSLYVSDGRLYVRDAGNSRAYALDGNGLTRTELSPSDTVLGDIPSDCVLFPEGSPAYAAEHLGYLPLLDGRDLSIAISGTSGSSRRRIAAGNALSAHYFGRKRIYLAEQGGGTVTVSAWDPETGTGTVLFTADTVPALLAEDGGWFYYSLQDDGADPMSAVAYYRIPISGGEPQAIGRVEAGPGMGGYQGDLRIFAADGDTFYYPTYSGFSVCLSRVQGSGGTPETLTPVLETSLLASLGETSAVSGNTGTSGQNDAPGISWYTETLTFSGDAGAAAMTQTMENARAAAQAYAEQLSAEQRDNSAGGAGDAHNLSGLAGVTALDWRIDGESGVTWLTDNYCCIRAEGRLRIGSSYRSYARNYFVFDRHTGRRLMLPDVTSSSENDIRELAAEAFARLDESTGFAFEEPEDLRETVREKIKFSSPFYLTPEGVVFYFSPGEIAPEVEGYPEVTIPWRSLKIRLTR